MAETEDEEDDKFVSPNKTIVHSKVGSKKDIFQSCMTEEFKKSTTLEKDDIEAGHMDLEGQNEEFQLDRDTEKGRLSSFEVIPDRASQLADSQNL